MSLATLSPGSSPDCPPRFGTERNRKRLTHGGRAKQVAEALGFELMPWQQHVLDVALEVDPVTGRLAYRRVLLTVPRQSGKTTLILVLFVLRALGFDGPQVMTYAAQTGVDARKKFIDEHVPLLEKSPLGSLFRVRMTNGHEAVLWKNGSRHHIGAGTEKSGHGTTLDLAVIDEAFAQPDGRLEQAFSPATITRPQPQLWFVSTAGKPSDTWFRDKVMAGREADPSEGVAYFEWSAPDDADPADPEVWRRCMPALGHTVTEQTILTEYAGMRDRPDEFRRAYLNQWVAKHTEHPIDPALWWALHDPESRPLDPLTFTVDVTPERDAATVAVAANRADGLIHAEVIRSAPGTAWVVALLLELRATWKSGAVRLLSKNPLGLDLEQQNVPVHYVPPGEYAQACAGLIDLTQRHGIRWNGADTTVAPLLAAVTAGRKKAQGEDFTWARKDSTDISPLVAVTLAAHGVRADRDRPGRFFAL